MLDGLDTIDWSSLTHAHGRLLFLHQGVQLGISSGVSAGRKVYAAAPLVIRKRSSKTIHFARLK
jgi:hypothetical protein